MVVGRLYGQSRTDFLSIVRRPDGWYELERSERGFDEEEELTYWIRVEPNPGGLYDSAATAKREAAERLRTMDLRGRRTS